MKESAKILQSVLSENKNFSQELISDENFIEKFLQYLLVFPEDKEDLLNYVNQNVLGIHFTENSIQSLSLKFMDELAETFSLNPSFTLNESKWLNNKQFSEKLNYYKTLKIAVRNSERKRIKGELDEMHSRLNFDVTDEDLEKSISIHSRKELKKKFRQWEDDVSQENEEKIITLIPKEEIKQTVNFSITPENKKSKSFSWGKLAVAACVLIVAGFAVFKLIGNPELKHDVKIVKNEKDNQIIKDTIHKQTTPNEQTTQEFPEKKILLADAESAKRMSDVLMSSALGYAGNNSDDEIEIESVSLKKRIQSLKDAYRETNENRYLSEAENLSRKSGKYSFDEHFLIMYDAEWGFDELKILKTEDQYYLFVQKENSFYKLNKSDEEQSFIDETDSEILEVLGKILFENE